VLNVALVNLAAPDKFSCLNVVVDKSRLHESEICQILVQIIG